jgi:hypothetical protein
MQMNWLRLTPMAMKHERKNFSQGNTVVRMTRNPKYYSG